MFLVSAAVGFLVLLNRLNVWAAITSPRNEVTLHHGHANHFYYTLRVLLNSVLCVVPIPLTGYFWGRFLTHNSSIDFNFAIGAGLQKAAISMFIIKFCIGFLHQKA